MIQSEYEIFSLKKGVKDTLRSLTPMFDVFCGSSVCVLKSKATSEKTIISDVLTFRLQDNGLWCFGLSRLESNQHSRLDEVSLIYGTCLFLGTIYYFQ